MKRTAILVIAATNSPLYVHYIETYWAQLIRHTNINSPNIDIYLLFEDSNDALGFEYLSDNIIIDENTELNGFFQSKNTHVYIPGILSKTVYAYELLQGEYDVFFRTNLSSMIHLKNFECFIESKNHIIYSGGSVWADALRANLVANGRVGKDQKLKSLAELDSYKGDTFVSGSGYFLSAPEVKQLIAGKKDIRYDLHDDVAIGLMMENYEYLAGFTLTLQPDEDITKMLAKLKSKNYCHVRLEHFPVDKARRLWGELSRIQFWV